MDGRKRVQKFKTQHKLGHSPTTPQHFDPRSRLLHVASVISLVLLSFLRPEIKSTGEIQMSSQCNQRNTLYPSCLCLFSALLSSPLRCVILSLKLFSSKWKQFVCLLTFLMRILEQIFIFIVGRNYCQSRKAPNLIVTRIFSFTAVGCNKLTQAQAK